jgi:hypothetical protein
MTAWTKHVTQHFRKVRATDKDYSFKQALKDAAKTYKKTGGEGESTAAAPAAVDEDKEGEDESTPAAATVDEDKESNETPVGESTSMGGKKTKKRRGGSKKSRKSRKSRSRKSRKSRK